MGIVLDTFESLFLGYITAIGIYMCFGFLVTRMGRHLLMRDDRMNPIYFILMALGWILAGLCSAFASFNFMLFGSKGSLYLSLAVGVILIGVLFRNHQERKHQQPIGINFLYSICIIAGCIAGNILRLRTLFR